MVPQRQLADGMLGVWEVNLGRLSSSYKVESAEMVEVMPVLHLVLLLILSCLQFFRS
jgi:hypothetical protein